jgi:nucleotidyltransferase/DNA polymerase involved in DNA repair
MSGASAGGAAAPNVLRRSVDLRIASLHFEIGTSPARHRSIRAALGRPTPGTGSGRTVTLKVKYADFQQITRSRTGQALLSTRAQIEQLSYALLEPLFPVTKGIRLLGMTLSSLAEKRWIASLNSASHFRLTDSPS